MLPPQAGATEVVPLDMQVHWDNRDVTVILTGELDCASAPDLTARLTDLLAKRPQRLVLDLANVTFMDCAGITPIARAYRALPPGHPVILRSPARQARQLLKITHIDQLCMIHDDLTAHKTAGPAVQDGVSGAPPAGGVRCLQARAGQDRLGAAAWRSPGITGYAQRGRGRGPVLLGPDKACRNRRASRSAAPQTRACG